ncbi:MAG TPA: isocitrate lyase/phosphoenolpyruvate mutase family protein [Dongiaceae bacterium]|jgi:2-methylisocitrate lyase-like PEP mutase family enzyme
MPTQTEKALAFRALHQRPGAFVIPNPWDAGSARLLSALGFEALATTSAGYTFMLGRSEGSISLSEALDNARAIVETTDLPVSVDLENGFGHDPKDCAAAIRAAYAAGLVGGSIEDATGDEARPIYDFAQSVERVEAAVEAARALLTPFVLTARSENFLHGRPDLDDTIRRLQAFEKAGAEVLYAPGLTKLEQIRAVCSSVSRPVNVVMGLVGGSFSVQQLAEVGVKRISLGSTLARVAYGALTRAAREISEEGTFSFAAQAIPFAEINRQMRPKGA